jgi:hypothetical protein
MMVFGSMRGQGLDSGVERSWSQSRYIYVVLCDSATLFRAAAMPPQFGAVHLLVPIMITANRDLTRGVWLWTGPCLAQPWPDLGINVLNHFLRSLATCSHYFFRFIASSNNQPGFFLVSSCPSISMELSSLLPALCLLAFCSLPARSLRLRGKPPFRTCNKKMHSHNQ